MDEFMNNLSMAQTQLADIYSICKANVDDIEIEKVVKCQDAFNSLTTLKAIDKIITILKGYVTVATERNIDEHVVNSGEEHSVSSETVEEFNDESVEVKEEEDYLESEGKGCDVTQLEVNKRKKKIRLRQCEGCGETFSLLRDLKKHQCPSPVEFCCATCKKTFDSKRKLSRHEIYHIKKHVCPYDDCGKAFGRQENLKDHINVHTGLKPYKCTLCGRGFSAPSLLHRHMRTHTGVKPYKCDECGTMFKHSGDLKNHKRVHSGETPYLCNICGVSFNRASKLSRHIKFHTGIKPHVCPVCQTGHVTKGNLRAHLRIHTGEKPFACDVCDQKFTMMAHKKRHMMTHTGEKPFKCEVCGKTFAQTGNLRAHLKCHQIPVSEKNTGGVDQTRGHQESNKIPNRFPSENPTNLKLLSSCQAGHNLNHSQNVPTNVQCQSQLISQVRVIPVHSSVPIEQHTTNTGYN